MGELLLEGIPLGAEGFIGALGRGYKVVAGGDESVDSGPFRRRRRSG
jgi:hypothetical protein